MSINELNDSVGSWNRFVKLKEAARERSFAANPGTRGASGAGGAAKFSEILSSKSGDNVYLNPAAAQAFRETSASAQPAKGKMFDSYA